MYDRILVPTDGCQGATKALDEAAALAQKAVASIHILHVVQPVYSAEHEFETLVQDLQTRGEHAVTQATTQIEEMKPITEVRMGVPHREILNYADQQDIDLIVMGTHGRTGLGRYLLGSVTEKVVRLSDIPVLTVRMDEE